MPSSYNGRCNLKVSGNGRCNLKVSGNTAPIITSKVLRPPNSGHLSARSTQRIKTNAICAIQFTAAHSTSLLLI